jgi:hypothetical protein
VTIELCIGIERHHEIDFAQRVAVVWPCNRVHVDDVDTETMCRGTWLDDPAVLDTEGLPMAHPASGYGFPAAIRDCDAHTALRRKKHIEVTLKSLI